MNFVESLVGAGVGVAVVGMDVGPSRLPKTDLPASSYTSLQGQLNKLGLLDAKTLD